MSPIFELIRGTIVQFTTKHKWKDYVAAKYLIVERLF